MAVEESGKTPAGAEAEEFELHTGAIRPTEAPDAIEFIDVHKSFGRNHVLRGLNMGLPEGKISMIIGPSGTGKSVCIKHMVGLLYPDEGDVLVHGESVPNMQDDDEYQWNTAKRTRSESAETDAVEFIDVKKSFGRNTVLNGLNLGIPEGQISMILGPSGTGKSVCIKHMVGLLYPDEGDVLVHGESVPNMADDDLFEMRKKFGVLFQDGALFGSMNLLDNVAFPLRQHTDKGEDEIMEIVNRRLGEVGLGDAGDKMPNELSGGMRKRAGFARALVLDPDIVLFDEPDSGLDPVRTALLCELIQEVHAENGGAYVVITHDIMSAKRVAEYIAVLWKGRIVESGPAEELFNSDNMFVRQFLSGASRGPLGME